MRKFFKEFGKFISKGNIIDLAIGIIIGTAFQAIVKSLVNDVIMPVIGVIANFNLQDATITLVPKLSMEQEWLLERRYYYAMVLLFKVS